MELNNLGFMNNNDMDYLYNIMLNQRELLLQKFVEGKIEKEYLEEIIYNFKVKYFKLQTNKVFLSNLKSEMNNNQFIPINLEENTMNSRNDILNGIVV